MADTAILSGGEVVDMFAECNNTIVARGAVIHDTGMIKHRGGKRRGAVAP